jgi:hypothetical protein
VATGRWLVGCYRSHKSLPPYNDFNNDEKNICNQWKLTLECFVFEDLFKSFVFCMSKCVRLVPPVGKYVKRNLTTNRESGNDLASGAVIWIGGLMMSFLAADFGDASMPFQNPVKAEGKEEVHTHLLPVSEWVSPHYIANSPFGFLT